MNTEQMIALVMKRRAEEGLFLKFYIPSEDRIFTCSPADNEKKEKWIKTAEKRGWKFLSDNVT